MPAAVKLRLKLCIISGIRGPMIFVINEIKKNIIIINMIR